MSLELLIGPMFAGKSSAIQSIVRKHNALGWPIYVITHSLDTRYSSEPAIVNHDQHTIPAVSCEKLMTLLNTDEYRESRLVIVEEAQFFQDLVPFIHTVVDVDKKNAVVVGLDGDAARRPFGKILDLIPLCDRVTKMTAFCKLCADGTPALFTFDNIHKAESHLGNPQVGGEERYSSLCRTHFLEGQRGSPTPL